MEKVDLKKLDQKLAQAVSLIQELRELEQAVTLKKGIVEDLFQDIMQNEVKFPKAATFTFPEVMQKIRELSRFESSGLVLPP